MQWRVVSQVFASYSPNGGLHRVAATASSTKLAETVPKSMGKSASKGQFGTKRSESWQCTLLTPRGGLPMKHAVCAHVVSCRSCFDASVVVAVFAHGATASATEAVQQWWAEPLCGRIVPVACMILRCCCLLFSALGVLAVVGVSQSPGHEDSSGRKPWTTSLRSARPFARHDTSFMSARFPLGPSALS